jgi:hypothetical protein
MIDEIRKAINELSREQVIEAAGFVSKDVAGIEPIEEILPSLRTITDQPYQSLPDVESLARLVLICAASSPEGKLAVQDAIAGTGRRQFILGGAEIVALAAIAVVALRIIVTRGRGRTKRSIELFDKEGRLYAKVEEIQEPVSITSELAEILKGTLGLPNAPESESKK